jgi:hypothetical protein
LPTFPLEISLKTKGTKGWLEAEGYFSLPSVVQVILRGDNFVALEKKP